MNKELDVLIDAVGQYYEIEIAKGTRLSDNIPCLPHGIIDKTYTGIGGTSLELDCERNSIVVVPYNNIADSKVSTTSIRNGYVVYKYAKQISNRTSKVSKPNGKIVSLSDYLEYVKESGQPIKIICVNDQLYSLRDALEKAREDFKSMFILFDEIDSMQEQSAFRAVMDICMDIYLAHPKDMRAMISATLRKFSHPDLANERINKIIEEDRPKDPLVIVQTDNGIAELYLQINRIIQNSPGKIVLACNHIKTAVKLAKTLEKDTSVKVGILCSPGTKSAVERWYCTLTAQGKLPYDVNITTAAYFNGCDFNEPYHSLIYSSITVSSLQLSPSTIYQITGRGRVGLLSSMLVVKPGKRMDDYTHFSKEDLLAVGKQISTIADSLKLMTVDLSVYGQLLLEGVHGLLVDGLKNLPAVFRRVSSTESEISYFKIDQRLMEQETCLLFEDISSYKKGLSTHFEIQEGETLYDDQSDVLDVDKQETVERFLSHLEEIITKEPKVAISELVKLKKSYSSLGIKEVLFIADAFLLVLSNGWNASAFTVAVGECNNTSTPLLNIKRLYCRLLWFTFKNDTRLHQVIRKGIAIGKEFSKPDFKQKVKALAYALSIHKNFQAVRYTEFIELIKNTPGLINDVILECTETSKRIEGKPTRLIKVDAIRNDVTPTFQFK